MIYSGLLSRWVCNCATPHKARLRLEQHNDTKDTAAPSLHLLLEGPGTQKQIEVRLDGSTYEQPEKNPRIPMANSNLLELKRQVQERLPASPSAPPQVSTRSTTDGFQKLSIATTASTRPSLLKSSQRYIGFDLANHLLTIQRSSKSSFMLRKSARFADTIASTSIQPQPAPPWMQLSEIKSICPEMSTWNLSPTCLGYIPTAEASRLLLYLDTRSPHSTDQSNVVTLGEILSYRGIPSETGRTLTRKQRFILANVLAFAILQLQPTSWLSSTWTKDDVAFIGPFTPSSSAFSHPYVSKTFPPNASINTISNEDCKQSLFRLGILLLELTFNKSLETLQIREKYMGPQGVPNEFTDLCTAKAWHREVEGECGEGMSEAIRRCIDCSFGCKPDWHDEEFLEEFFGHVLEPLRVLLRQWEGNA